MGTPILALVIWTPILLSQIIFAQIIRGPYVPYNTYNPPVTNLPAPILNLPANLPISQQPIKIIQLSGTGLPMDVTWRQNLPPSLPINGLPINGLPFNNLPVTDMPVRKKIALVKFNIPIVERVPIGSPIIRNMPVANNVMYDNLPMILNSQIVQPNNLPITATPNLVRTNVPENIPVANTVMYENLPMIRQILQPNNLPITVNVATPNLVRTLPIRNRIVTKVPVVPLNRIANLPTYNGMPVIKVKQTVYKIL